jgi:hypothetical protein
LTGADGGNVAVSESLGFSNKYFSTQHLHGFRRTVCIGPLCSTSAPSLLINGLIHLDDLIDPVLSNGFEPYSVPIVAHALNPNRLVIATGSVYESDDAGDTLRRLGGKFTGTATRALAFGSTGLRNILYVGSPDGLFRHTTKFGPMQRLDSYTFGIPVVMTLDPNDWQSAWVINAPPGTQPNTLSGNSIWHTPTGGIPQIGQETWTDVTANLGPGGLGAEKFHAIAFVPTRSGGIIFVGASDGLYARSTTPSACWFKLHGALPNAVVFDLDFDETDDLLLITTLGRGTWTIASPGNISLPTACRGIVELGASPVSAR